MTKVSEVIKGFYSSDAHGVYNVVCITYDDGSPIMYEQTGRTMDGEGKRVANTHSRCLLSLNTLTRDLSTAKAQHRGMFQDWLMKQELMERCGVVA